MCRTNYWRTIIARLCLTKQWRTISARHVCTNEWRAIGVCHVFMKVTSRLTCLQGETILDKGPRGRCMNRKCVASGATTQGREGIRHADGELTLLAVGGDSG